MTCTTRNRSKHPVLSHAGSLRSRFLGAVFVGDVTQSHQIISFTDLIREMVRGSIENDDLQLLFSRIEAWIINLFAFSLLYWQSLAPPMCTADITRQDADDA